MLDIKHISHLDEELDAFDCHVEPGDMTHYHFILIRESETHFAIAPGTRSTFRFPQRMNYYDSLKIVGDEFGELNNEISTDYGCNPHTTLTVAKTIINLVKPKNEKINS